MDTVERIKELRERQRQLAARLALMEARERGERRKRDTRRKIVIGAAVLALARRNQLFARWLEMRLPEVVEERDRPLIGQFDQRCDPP